MAKKKTEFVDKYAPQRVVKDTFTLYNLPCDTDVTGLIGYLSGIRDEHGHDSKILIATETDGYGEYLSDLEVRITTFRDETPAEIEKRIAKAKKDAERATVQRIKNLEKAEKQKKKDEQAELNLLKRLQKKYSGYNFESIEGV